jgi:uroporphyrin-3 C-methyltransferase
MDENERPDSSLPADPEPGDPKPETPVPAPARPRRTERRRGGGFGILLALVAIAMAGFATWRVWTLERAREADHDARSAALAQRIDALVASDEQVKQGLDTLRARLADADSVNRSLREEFLGLTERSRNLEDAVSHLAEQRLTGRDALALNEAEFLLQLGAERLALFHDAQAAQEAYRLADSALAAAEDPVFASVRRTISAERQALAAAGSLPTRATLVALERLRQELADLPVARSAPDTDAVDAAPQSRFLRLLERFVRVRHDADAAAEFATRDASLSRSLIALDLRNAEAALLARDPDAFRAALVRVHAGIEGLFASGDAMVAAVLAEIDQLADTPLAPNLPELGSALAELRNLRTTRALAHPPAPATPTAPVAPVEPAPAATDPPIVPPVATGDANAEVGA